MQVIIGILGLVSIIVAQPTIQLLTTQPILYPRLQSGAPIGLDGKVIDTPEVAQAKAEHAAAHLKARIGGADVKAQGGAPIGLDGRVVDTPEVVLAKAEHAAAHLNEQLQVNSADSNVITFTLAKLQPGAPIGLDGRVLDTPEVVFAKAKHAAAHINAGNTAKILPAVYSSFVPSPIVPFYI